MSAPRIDPDDLRDAFHAAVGDGLKTAIKRVQSFADDMRAQGIHVGMGAQPLACCVTCGEAWPCSGSKS